METDAAHSRLGCSGVRHLAHEFHTQQHPLAGRRLLLYRRLPGACRPRSAWRNPAIRGSAYPPTRTTPASTRCRRFPERRCVCRTNLASRVSRTKLAEDAGTTKLSGSLCTSAIKVKNETIARWLPRIRSRRRAPSAGTGRIACADRLFLACFISKLCRDR